MHIYGASCHSATVLGRLASCGDIETGQATAEYAPRNNTSKLRLVALAATNCCSCLTVCTAVSRLTCRGARMGAGGGCVT
jgi:hypothetical protein